MDNRLHQEPFAHLLMGGQVLMMLNLNNNDEECEVRFTIWPKGLGLCSCAIGFGSSDKGEQNARKFFDKCLRDESEAKAFLSEFIGNATSMAPRENDDA